MTGRAWILNFDAEYELAMGPSYTPSSSVRARTVALRDHVKTLIGDDLVVDETTPKDAAKGLLGAAWCPTPRALATLRRAGATVEEAPSIEVLREANHRAFSHRVGPNLPLARFSNDAREIASIVESPIWTHRWVLKRPLDLAGRGRQLAFEGPLDERLRAWVDASLREGDGLAIEPWVERRGDFALHGAIGRGGETTLGEPTRQVLDEHGSWQRTELATVQDLDVSERDTLASTAERVARSLVSLGYFGPFGIDAFRYEGADGHLAFHPLCEINARYTMGFAVGMAGVSF